MPPCHGGGRGFESRPVRHKAEKTLSVSPGGFFRFVAGPLLYYKSRKNPFGKSGRVFSLRGWPVINSLFQGGIIKHKIKRIDPHEQDFKWKGWGLVNEQSNE